MKEKRDRMVELCGFGRCDREKCDITGTLVDFVTGEEVADTVVERVRQDTEKFLVEKKDYSKSDIEVGREFEIDIAGEKTKLYADLLVKLGEKSIIIIKCTFDSLMSKERLIVSYARLLFSYQVPYAVVANMEGAEVLDTISGKVIGGGFDSIPSKVDLKIGEIEFKKFPDEKVEMEKRILSAFESLDESMCNR